LTQTYYLFCMILSHSRMLYAELLERCDLVCNCTYPWILHLARIMHVERKQPTPRHFYIG